MLIEPVNPDQIEQFKATFFKVKEELRDINRKVDMYFTTVMIESLKEVNWGANGSMARVLELLKEVNQFLGPIENLQYEEPKNE